MLKATVVLLLLAGCFGAAGPSSEESGGSAVEEAARLFERGQERQGAKAAAELVLDGEDLTGLFYSWLHTGRPGTPQRRYVAISRALLDRYGDLSAVERQRADAFLCQEDAGYPPLETCSPDAVRARLRRIEKDF